MPTERTLLLPVRASITGVSTIGPDEQAAHDAAVERGDAMYVDPSTGYSVMTSATLLDRGYCCGNGCRHCPYGTDEATSDAARP